MDALLTLDPKQRQGLVVVQGVTLQMACRKGTRFLFGLFNAIAELDKELFIEL